jgi:hypothetical protein
MKKQESFKNNPKPIIKHGIKSEMTNILISPRLLIKIVSQTIPPTSMKKQGFLDCKTGAF